MKMLCALQNKFEETNIVVKISRSAREMLKGVKEGSNTLKLTQP